jgi:TonB family protein
MKHLIALLLFGLMCSAVNAQQPDSTAVIADSCTCTEPFASYAEQMPQFPGGQAAFDEYVRSKTNNTQNVGSFVYIEFTVSESGKICNASVKRGIAGMPQLDRSALKIIRESPPWNPGVMNGKNICVTMIVPVKMPPPKTIPR